MAGLDIDASDNMVPAMVATIHDEGPAERIAARKERRSAQDTSSRPSCEAGSRRAPRGFRHIMERLGASRREVAELCAQHPPTGHGSVLAPRPAIDAKAGRSTQFDPI
jgi:hypothetical protein